MIKGLVLWGIFAFGLYAGHNALLDRMADAKTLAKETLDIGNDAGFNPRDVPGPGHEAECDFVDSLGRRFVWRVVPEEGCTTAGTVDAILATCATN
jgi:hypothetical protein